MSPAGIAGRSLTAAVALLWTLPATSAAEPSWYRLADAPAPRQEISYVAVGGSAYLAGGGDRAQDRYDLSTDGWTSVAPLPAALAGADHVRAAAVGGEIVYAGGVLRWEDPFPVIGDVAVYDVAHDAFTAGTDMPAPRATGGVAAWQGMVIYAGGLGPEGSVARVDAYDPASDSWTRLQDLPQPRDHFQLAVAGDGLYAVGGRLTSTGPDGIGIEEIGAVDRLALPSDPAGLAAASWTAGVTRLPTPRGGLGVAAVGDCVYVVGGEATSFPPPGVTGRGEAYDTASGTWQPLPPLGTPRHGIDAAVSGQTILVAGGGVESFAGSPTAVQEALDVSSGPPCTALPHPVSSAAPAPKRAAHVLRLSVRPGRPRSGARARALVVLSSRGRALIRAQRAVPQSPCPPSRRPASCRRWRPTSLRFKRRLPAGRSFIRLPLGAHPLAPGRYRLLAATPADLAAGRSARDGFRVLP